MSSPAPADARGTPRPRLPELPEGHTRVVCVGDMHDDWGATDEAAVGALRPDVVLFVGDYGNENVEVVRRIAEFAGGVDFFVGAVLGNHDGFFSMSHTGRNYCPYDANKEDRVREQMELLEPFNPSYRSLEAKEGPLPLSVVGGRPLTWGGPYWKHAQFYREYFKVYGMSQSADIIKEAAVAAAEKTLLFVSHNGPTGLGKLPSDPCGKDWGEKIGGDYGDSDLRDGIEAARRVGKAVPLVVFGHMHHRLRHGGLRTMLKTERDGESGEVTVMLDAAVVPRHRRCPSHDGIMCQFNVVELNQAGYVDSVEQVWATGTGEVIEAKSLFERSDVAREGNAPATASPVAVATAAGSESSPPSSFGGAKL